MRRAAVALVLLAVAVGVGGELVSADAPHKSGWWNRLQGATPLTTVPPLPGSAPGGLTVARDPTGELAVAAVYLGGAEGADATLYLEGANANGVTLPPGASVDACPIVIDWEPVSNGRWADRPSWLTDSCAAGTVDSAGKGMFWYVPGSMQVDGAFNLALVANGQTSYTVHFAAPGATAFSVAESATTTTEPETTTTTEAETTTTVATTETTAFEVPRDTAPLALPTTTSAVPRQSTRTSLVAAGPLDRLPAPLRPPQTRAERIMAVSLLLAMAGALWWLGGNPARLPRLIGALAGDASAARLAEPPARGVGRFARVRNAVRPPRL